METLRKQTPQIQESGERQLAKTRLPLPWAIWFWTQARKIVVLVSGMTVLFAGVVMLVTPGPGLVGIVAGLAILGTEFAWARWMLKHAKERASQLIETAQKQFTNSRHSS